MTISTATERAAGAADRRRWQLGRRARNALLTAHIVVSVGLLGDSAGFLAVAIRRAASDDPKFVTAAHDVLGTFALFFGIPLSFLALLTGIGLGVGTRWGLFRYPWVAAKLVLVVTVIVVGATLLRPVVTGDETSGGDAPLIIGASYDVAALTVAAALAVFKPGRPIRPRRDPTVPGEG